MSRTDRKNKKKKEKLSLGDVIDKNISGKRMIKEKTWSDFRETGLFVILNQFLHVFGWALVAECDIDSKTGEEILLRVYPARCKFRGFGEESTDQAYKKVTKYLKSNIKALEKETNS